MPYPVGSAIAETGSERHVTKKSSDLNKLHELKKSDSAAKQEKEEYYSATINDPPPSKQVKKTGIPRVKSKPLEKRSSRDEKRDSEKRSTHKITTEDKNKRTGSAIMDKTPNKKAQRTKGSTTIGRIPAPATRSRPTSSAVHLSRPCTREEDHHPREEVQTPTSKLRPLKKGSRPKIKLATKDSKVEDGINVQTKKSSWLLEKGEEKSKKHNKQDGVEVQRPLKKESDNTTEDDKSDDPEMAKGFMPPLPSSTCSLFEKIQQSVRAYFTSKSTTTPRVVGTSEEPPKPKTNLTEGGIDVGLTGEEEPKKGRANLLRGVKKHSKINVKTTINKKLTNRNGVFAGGQSHSLSLFDAKRNIYRHFWEIERKKLYRPKKHYVRIQIPRKGYFYRSYVYLRPPSFLPTRVESDCVQKSEPKVQIARLAASSPQSSNICQKRVKPGVPKCKRLMTESSHRTNVDERLKRSRPRNWETGNGNDGAECCWLTRDNPNDVLSHDNSNNEMIFLQFDRQYENDNSLNLNRKRFFEPGSKFRRQNSSSTDSTSMTTNGDLSTKRRQVYVDSHQYQDEFTDGGSLFAYDAVQNLTPTPCGGDNLNTSEETKMLKDLLEPRIVENGFADSDSVDKPNCECGVEDDAATTNGQTLSLYNERNRMPFQPNFTQKSFPNELNRCENIYTTLMGDIDLHSELENYLKVVRRNDAFPDVKIEEIENENANETRGEPVLESKYENEEQPEVKLMKLLDGTAAASSARKNQIESLKISQHNLLSDKLLRKHPTINVTNTNKGKTEEKLLDLIESYNDKKYWNTDVKHFPIPSREFDSGYENNLPEKVILENIFTTRSVENENVVFDKYEKLTPVKAGLNLCQTMRAEDIDCRDLSNVRSKIKSKIIDLSHLQLLDDVEDDVFEETAVLNVEKRSSEEELLKMYKSVLKEFKKTTKFYTKPSNPKSTNSLLSFIDDLLKAKKNDSEPLKLPPINGSNSIPLSTPFDRYFYGRRQTGFDTKQNHLTMEEYVDLVQQMLSSKLSLQQISTLNKITAKLQENRSTKTNRVKSGKTHGNNLKTNKANKDVKGSSDVSNKHGTVDLTKPKSKKVLSKMKTVLPGKSGSDTISTDRLIIKGKSLELIKSLELSTPEVLKSLLREQFYPSNECFPLEEDTIDTTLVVTVKLSDDKIMVNGVNQINHDNFYRDDHRSKEMSDLIIENVKGKQLNGLMIDKKIDLKKVATKPAAKPKSSSGKGLTTVAPVKIKPAKSDVSKENTKILKRPKKPEIDEIEIINLKKNTVPIGDFFTRKNQKLLRFPKRSYKKTIRKSLYEYDQQKLKAQHPIEAIVEGSESKIDELSCDESEYLIEKTADPVRNRYFDYDNTYSVHEAEKIKDFRANRNGILNQNPTNVIKSTAKRNKSNASRLNRTKSHVLDPNIYGNRGGKSQAKKCAKSLEDTSCARNSKANDSIPKNCRQKSQLRKSNVCYLVSSELFPLSKEKKKDRKTKNESRKSISVKRSNEHEVLNKKRSKNFKEISSAMESTTFVPLDEPLKKKESCDKIATLFNDSKSPIERHEKQTDDGGARFLYNDSHNSNASQDSSESEEPLKTENEDVMTQMGELESYFFCEPGVEFSGKGTESDTSRKLPVFIHPPKSDNLEISFPSLMIHSDSFLMSKSTFILSKSNFKCLFKSNSDMKFFPGRINENGEQRKQQQQPFVTFFLTPKQKAVAGVPSEQVQVIFPEALTSDNCNSDGTKSNEPSFEEQKKILRSVEEFIETLSKHKMKENPNKFKKEMGGRQKRSEDRKIYKKRETKADSTKPESSNPKKNQRCIACRVINHSSLHKNGHQNQIKSMIESNEPNKPNLTNNQSKYCIQLLEIEQSKQTDVQTTITDKKTSMETTKPSSGQKEPENAESLKERLMEASKTVIKSLPIETENAFPLGSNMAEKDQHKILWTCIVRNGNSTNSNRKFKTPKIKIRCNPKKLLFEEMNRMKRRQKKRNLLLQKKKMIAAEKLHFSKEKMADCPLKKKLSLVETPSIYFDAESDEPEFENLSNNNPIEKTEKDCQLLKNEIYDDKYYPKIPILNDGVLKPPQTEKEWNIEEKILNKVIESLKIENLIPALILEAFLDLFKSAENEEGSGCEPEGVNNVQNLTKSSQNNKLLKLLSHLNEFQSNQAPISGDSSTSPTLTGKIIRMAAILDHLERQVSNARLLMTDIKILTNENPVDERPCNSTKMPEPFFGTKPSQRRDELLQKHYNDGLIAKVKNSFAYLKNKISKN